MACAGRVLRGPVPESCELTINNKIALFARDFKDARTETVKKCGKTAVRRAYGGEDGMPIVFFLKFTKIAVDISDFACYISPGNEWTRTKMRPVFS